MSMSGGVARGGGGSHGDGDHAAAGFTAYAHDDHDDIFFLQSLPCGGGGGDGLMATPYSSIVDYLQGFLDPAGMAAHFDDDVAPPGRAPGDDGVAVVEQQTGAAHFLGPHRGGGQQQAVAGAPVTPNLSVRSSSSCDEAGTGDEPRRRRGKKGRPDPEEEEELLPEAGDDEDDGSAPAAGDGNCKRSKEHKRRGEKKPREARVAFMTRSEVDHLEDGYRWRKYGQKAVKSSSYPRSYYRCTAARCGVKKRVERSQQDPSTVITTYEGQHTHQSPVGLLLLSRGAAAASPLLTPSSSLLPPFDRGLPLPTPPMHLLHQEHSRRRASSQQQLELEASYGGGVLVDSIPSFRDEHAYRHC